MHHKKFTFRDFQILVGLILLGLVLAAALIALNWWLAGQFGVGADLLPAWNGARAFIIENTDPYSQTMAQQTQKEVYGRPPRPGDFPYALDIPFPLLVLFLPLLYLLEFLSQYFLFIGIPDTIWIRAIWMTLAEIGLLLLVFLSLRLSDWRPNRGFGFLLLIFSLTWSYSLVALGDGSFSILLALALVGALFAMRDFNDELAGFLLAISAMKWEATLLLWLLLILAAFTARRWRVFAGLGMTWFALGAAGFLLYPDWFWPWMRAVMANWRADDVFTPALFLQDWLPDFGPRLWLIVESVFLLVLVLEWFSALRGKDFRRVAWVAALSIAFTPLLGFSNTFANLAPLVFSFVFILPFAWERWKKSPYLILTLITILFFVFPLLLKLPAVASRLSTDALAFLVPPLAIIIGLYWIRWTVIHPPRTWLDEVKRELRN